VSGPLLTRLNLEPIQLNRLLECIIDLSQIVLIQLVQNLGNYAFDATDFVEISHIERVYEKLAFAVR